MKLTPRRVRRARRWIAQNRCSRKPSILHIFVRADHLGWYGMVECEKCGAVR